MTIIRACDGKTILERLMRTGMALTAHRQARGIDAVKPLIEAISKNESVKKGRLDESYYHACLAMNAAAYTWAQCGFPRLATSHTYAASLMMTRLPPELVPEVCLPWASFSVDIPDKLIGLTDPAPFRFVLISVMNGGLALIVMSEQSVRYCVFGKTLGDLLEVAAEKAESDELLAVRFALGMTIAATEHRPTCDALPRRLGVKTDPRTGAPRTHTFKIVRDVRVDAREVVRGVSRGDISAKASVQSLVRGHWKHQPCGAGRSDRKFIHIEPYWRGPEDAPIAVRSHHLVGP